MRPLLSSRSTEHSVNLVVQVSEYVEGAGGEVWVHGKDMVNNQDVWVALTTSGISAQHAKRPKLAAFRDGTGNLGTKVGGVIGFERCYRDKQEGRYRASWPCFMAGSDDQASLERVRINHPCTLELSGGHEANRFAVLSVWQPINVRTAGTLKEALEVAQGWINYVPKQVNQAKGATLIRALNQAGKVVAYEFIQNRYRTEEKRPETGEESVAAFEKLAAAQEFVKLSTERRATSFGVVPVINYTVSHYWVREQGARVEVIASQFRKEGRDGELVAKAATFVLDTKATFANLVLVHDPYGDSGWDPVLFTQKGEPLEYDPVCAPGAEESKTPEPGHLPAQGSGTSASAPAFNI
jgi:hypothetical protein